MQRGLWLMLAAVVALGCTSTSSSSGAGGATSVGGAASGGSGSGADGGAGGAGVGGTATGGGGAGTPVTCEQSGYVHQPKAIAGCDGLGPGTEDCHYRIVYDLARCCPGAPCDRLLVFWSGGNQTCDDDDAFDGILEGYADAGFVAVCAQPYTTEDEGGKYPYHAEFDRMNRVMQAIRADVAELWTGEKLLNGGTSHGGTAPIVVVASTDALDNHTAVWTGSTHTAMMLNDGISNPRTLEEWTGATSGCGLFHSRFVGRYHGGTGPLVHACDNDRCYCSGLSDTTDWAKDTIVIGAQDPTSPYTCADFEQTGAVIPYRFIACSGQAANPCGILGDIIPDAQQQTVSTALDACSGLDVSYQRYPDCSHVACGGWAAGCGAADSLTWLSQLGW